MANLIAGDNIVEGIREEDLLSLCDEILKNADSIYEKFNQIDNKFEEIKEYYSSSSLDTLMSKYQNFKKNYSIIKNNIISYSEDLNELIIKLKSGLQEVATKYDQYSEDIKSKKKAVENLKGGM